MLRYHSHLLLALGQLAAFLYVEVGNTWIMPPLPCATASRGVFLDAPCQLDGGLVLGKPCQGGWSSQPARSRHCFPLSNTASLLSNQDMALHYRTGLLPGLSSEEFRLVCSVGRELHVKVPVTRILLQVARTNHAADINAPRNDLEKSDASRYARC